MIEKKSTKQYKTLCNKIKDSLKDFEKNREWADLDNWLSRLKPLLSTRKFEDFPHKINMAQRLAQCLNKNLPSGVHSNALSVYNTILSNFGNKTQLLPLMSIGLFPFFEESSSVLKIELLKIFSNHFVNDHECIQMILSLMNTLLTGLNDNNEALSKQIFALCDKMAKDNGRVWIDGAVWVNILKSPKVRIAGLKYLSKSFKDRDKEKIRILENEEEIKQTEKQGKQSLIDSIKTDKSSTNKLTEAESVLLHQLLEVKQYPDNHKTRFPNFSSLVVNALCVCLEGYNQDTLVCRSALDLMIFYLKLEDREMLSKQNAVVLISVMLKAIRLKEYSLTRRIYTYLFGQPNMDGQYAVSKEERGYELELLKSSLRDLFSADNASDPNAQSHLLILEILLKDHEALSEEVLPALACRIFKFMRLSKIPSKRIQQFYQEVVEVRNSIFTHACLSQLLEEEVVGQEELAKSQIETIEFYCTIKVKNDGIEKSVQDISNTIHGLLRYLQQSKCMYTKTSIQAIELCLKLNKYFPESSKLLSKQSVEIINDLISHTVNNRIYAGLLTLHPLPPKQTLLPYISEASLSVVCLSNLLQLQPEALIEQEKKSIFLGVFKLLNFHLMEEQAINLIQVYQEKHHTQFVEWIDEVEASEWSIYWNKMNGDVEGGVIRMLRNLEHANPLTRHLSRKWLENSKMIIGKVLKPVYSLLVAVEAQSEGLREIFKMIQDIFLNQHEDFVSYFYIHEEKYLRPLTNAIFSCLEGQDQDLKSEAIAMLQFLISRTVTLNEKLTFVQLTMEKTLRVLRVLRSQKDHSYLREIQIISYLRSVSQIFPKFIGHKEETHRLEKLIGESATFAIVAEAMKETDIPYVRTLYLDFLSESTSTFTKLAQDKNFLTATLTIILEKLFPMLRENDVTCLQQAIKEKVSSFNRRKKSDVTRQLVETMGAANTEFNIQAKYARVIQLWNSVKFFVKISIECRIHELPIGELLSIILLSFPFSHLKYKQISQNLITVEYEALQEEIRNLTGLKKQVLGLFEALWENYEEIIIDYLIEKVDPRVLIHGSVDPSAVMKAIRNSLKFKKIVKYVQVTKLGLPKNTLHYNIENVLLENKICHFLYLYMLYCNFSLIRNKKLSNFVNNCLSLLKSLRLTSHIQTKIWIIEIIYCLSERVVFEQLERNSKQEFQYLTRELLDELVLIAVRSKNFTHRFEIKKGLFSIFSKQEKETSLFDFVKTFPPAIHQIFTEYENKMKNQLAQVTFVQEGAGYLLFGWWANQSQQSYIEYLSIAVMKTFASIYVKLVIKIFELEVPKLAQIVRDHLNPLLPCCEDKSAQNQIFNQNVSEFLHSILRCKILRSQVIKLVRKNVVDLFYGDDFFKCTKETLNYWKKIIDYCTKDNDMLGDLLTDKFFEGFMMFMGKSAATHKKIKNFERVCFIIYAGKIDKYEHKLRTVLESLIFVMREQNPSAALLILILFCIRILFIRLSEGTLNRIFKSLWPSLIALLIQIFSKQAFKRNNCLLLAALKVIELVHALQLEEFNIHKWIFIFDHFGIRVDAQTEEESQLHGSTKILSPFCFKPLLTNFLPHSGMKCSYIPEQWPQETHEVLVRKLVVKQSRIDSDDELSHYAFVLLQYMMDLNQKRVVVVKEQIEDLIEADFISLDDYIFDME